MKSRILLLMGGLLLAFLSAEAALRCYRFFVILPHLSEPQGRESPSEGPGRLPTMDDIPGLFVPDSQVIYRYRPGTRVRWEGVVYEINSQGWRGPDWPKVRKEDKVILCLGDSITFGYGVPFEETFCSRLQGLLKKKFPQHPPIVLNAATSGYNIEQKVRVFEDLLPTWKPDVVILNFYRDDTYLSLFGVDPKGRLYSLPEPENTYPPSPFALCLDFLIRHSLFLRVLQQRLSSFVSFGILQWPSTAAWSRQAHCWQRTEGKLRELVQLARSSNVQVVFAYFPDIAELGVLKINPDFLRFTRIAKELQVPVVDIRAVFQQYHLKEPIYLDLCHPNARGHELAASLLRETVEPLLTSR